MKQNVESVSINLCSSRNYGTTVDISKNSNFGEESHRSVVTLPANSVPEPSDISGPTGGQKAKRRLNPRSRRYFLSVLITRPVIIFHPSNKIRRTVMLIIDPLNLHLFTFDD